MYIDSFLKSPAFEVLQQKFIYLLTEPDRQRGHYTPEILADIARRLHEIARLHLFKDTTSDYDEERQRFISRLDKILELREVYRPFYKPRSQSAEYEFIEEFCRECTTAWANHALKMPEVIQRIEWFWDVWAHLLEDILKEEKIPDEATASGAVSDRLRELLFLRQQLSELHTFMSPTAFKPWDNSFRQEVHKFCKSTRRLISNRWKTFLHNGASNILIGDKQTENIWI